MGPAAAEHSGGVHAVLVELLVSTPPFSCFQEALGFPGDVNVQWQSVKISGKLTEIQDQRNGVREPGFEVIFSNHGILF